MELNKMSDKQIEFSNLKDRIASLADHNSQLEREIDEYMRVLYDTTVSLKARRDLIAENNSQIVNAEESLSALEALHV